MASNLRPISDPTGSAMAAMATAAMSLHARRATPIEDIFPVAGISSPTDASAPAAGDSPPTAPAAGPNPETAAPVGSTSDEATGAVTRLELIRQAARRISQRDGTKPRLPLVTVCKAPESRIASVPDWTAQRRVRLEGAVEFLRQRGILVWPNKRDALVRLYRMTGNFNLFTAEQVIARAERLGWDGGAQ